MIIRIQSRLQKMHLDPRKVRAAIRTTLRALKLPDAELSLVFLDCEEMAEMNRRFMGRSGPTDVLSFPVGPVVFPKGAPRPLGDIIVCPEYVQKQARRHSRLFRQELAHVMIHGVLHLLGYDHHTPRVARRMRDEEKRILPLVGPKLVGVL